MPFTIAIAGKGGVGKTTIAGLIIHLLPKPILAVDADPNANLNEVLGMKVETTIGELREETLEKINDLPAGIPKETYLEYGLHECLVEGDGIDLLVMGYGEGPKCYCMVNHILRKYIDILRQNYQYVVIDNEAGMEHLSRRTTQDVDALLIVANDNPISIQSAKKINELASALKLRVKKKYLVLNNVSERQTTDSQLREETGLEVLGVIPQDETILNLSLRRKPLTELNSSVAKRAVAEMIKLIKGGFYEDRGS